MTRTPQTDDLASLKRLHPGLNEEQYASLDAWYSRYASLISRMHERIANDPKEYARFLALTNHSSRPTMTEKVDCLKENASS